VDDGVAVFHRKETTKATLKHLAFQRPSGITAPEANDLLDRRCYRALRNLADQQEIHAVEHRNTTVYVHSWPSLRDAQLSQRETDQPTDVSPVDTDEEGYLYRDELLATFLSVAVSDSVDPARTSRRSGPPAVRGRLLRRPRTPSPTESSFREALDYMSQRTSRTGRRSGVPSTTFTPMNSVTASSRCGDLLADHDHAGEFVVIDGTHIAAWANTREEIDDGEVEGASWGKHEGKFYGYKVYIVVDEAAELPVAITMETGSRNDCAALNRSSRSSMSGTTPTISRQHWLMRASTAKAIESSPRRNLTVRC